MKLSHYLVNVLIGIDQLGNTLFAGDPDETISSRIGRLKRRNGGTIPWSRPIPKILEWALDKVDDNHCTEHIEEKSTSHRRDK